MDDLSSIGDVGAAKDTVAATDDRRGGLLGPFRRPVHRDWAFWLFVVVVVGDLVVRLVQATVAGTGPNAAQILLFEPFAALGILVIFAIVIGIPRGFRDGCAVADQAPPTARCTPAPG